MKKRSLFIAGASLLIMSLLLPIYLRSELFRQFYDRRLRRCYLESINTGEDWGFPDGREFPTLVSIMEFWGDMCAVIKVTKGMEDSLGDAWHGDPREIWKAEYKDIDVEVEEYLYDKTGNYFTNLTLRDRNVAKWERIYAYTGERLLIFMNVLGSGLCQATAAWGYIITEQGYLVPLTDRYHEAMNEYGGRKLNVLRQDILHTWETDREEKSLYYTISTSLMEFVKEPGKEIYCSFVPVKKEEKEDSTIQVAVWFERKLCGEDGLPLKEGKEGILELVLKKKEQEYRVFSLLGYYLEERKDKKGWQSFVTEEEMKVIEQISKDSESEWYYQKKEAS